MKSLKRVLLLLSILIAITAPYFSAHAATTIIKKNKTVSSISANKKIYRIPGAAVIGFAKRHHYQFHSYLRIEKTSLPSLAQCEFIGMHWNIPANTKCEVIGFHIKGATSKCKVLRKGWKVKDLRLKGNYIWKFRPDNTEKPRFSVISNNTTNKTKIITIDWVEFEGPDGPANHWEAAFDHCSDANYRP